MDKLTLKMINHTIDWHRPRPQDGIDGNATILCACSDMADYDSYGYIEHLKRVIANDLELYGKYPIEG